MHFAVTLSAYTELLRNYSESMDYSLRSPFGSHKVRSIFLQAKLVPRSFRLPRNDCIHTGKISRGESEIHSAIEEGWLKIWPEPVALEETIDLDEGESACIQIAINHDDDVLLIMDERAGRAHALEKEAYFIYRFTVCHLDEGEILVLRALRSLVVRTSPPSG